jgi:hypothetical protein
MCDVVGKIFRKFSSYGSGGGGPAVRKVLRLKKQKVKEDFVGCYRVQVVNNFVIDFCSFVLRTLVSNL